MNINMVIGIGDLHGNYSALEKLLFSLGKELRIFQEPNKLSPGIELVFLGDYIDRGANGKKILNRLINLQTENPNTVTCCLGNHELLALSNWGYLKNLNFGDGSDSFNSYKSTLHGSEGGMNFLREFGRNNQDCVQNYIRKMSASGKIGNWMRHLKALYLTSVGERRILFVHGGISERFSNDLGKSVESFGDRVTLALPVFIETGKVESDLSFQFEDRESSIFWDRSIPFYSSNPQTIVRNLGVDYLVIGHTSQSGIISYGGCAFDIDVGMAQTYRENAPAAIIFQSNQIKAFYCRREGNQFFSFL